MPSEMKAFANFIPQAMTSPIWQDDSVFKLYLYCLSRASHNRCVWRGIQLEPGDMPLAERHASIDLCWSRNKLDRKLKLLHQSGYVRVERIPQKGLMLHITNWLQNRARGFPKWSQFASKLFQNGARFTTKRSQFPGIRLQNGAKPYREEKSFFFNRLSHS